MGQLAPPIVVLNGTVLPNVWDGGSVVALSSLAIDWGRQTFLDPVDPAILTLTLIDPHGTWSTQPGLVGQGVDVRRTRSAGSANINDYVFRGTITDVSTEPVRVRPPGSEGKTVQVWRTQLIVADRLGQLAKIFPAGPTPTRYYYEPENGYFSNNDTGAQRRQAILDAGAGGIVDGIASPPPYTSLASATQSAPYGTDEHLTALELIRRHYHRGVLKQPQYHARYNQVDATGVVASPAVALTRAGTQVTVDAPGAFVLGANQLQMLEDRQLSESEQDTIKRVTVRWRGNPIVVTDPEDSTTRNSWWADTEYTCKFAGDDGSATGTLDYEMDVGYVGGSSPVVQVGNAVLLAVSQLGAKHALPRVLFDFTRSDAPSVAIEDALLDPRAYDIPWFLVGCLYHAVRNVGPAFHLIGGRITYGRPDAGAAVGWRSELQFGPTTGTPVPIQLDQLSDSSTARFSDVDPRLTLADLGQLSAGLPA